MESCRKQNSPESLAADPSARADLASAKDSLVSYFACKAFASKESPPCAELAGWTHDGDPIDRNCRERYYESRFVMAALRGGADRMTCSGYMENTDGCRYEEFFKPRDYSALCDAVSGVLLGRTTPDQVCRRAQRQGICRNEPQDFLHCREALRFAQGEPARCSRVGLDQRPKNGMGFSLLQRACFDHASLVRALRAGSADACGDSSFCRAALGAAPKPCQEDRDRLVETYCLKRLEARGSAPRSSR